MSALYTSADLRAALAVPVPDGIAAHGINIDTRKLAGGDIFVALRSDTGNGHDFLGAAAQAGAACAIVDTAEGAPPGLPLIVVPDTQAALTALGRFGRQRFAGRVIAITGSVGKTTTKEMLRQILGASGITHAAQASFNNHLGVPLTLALIPRDAAYAVVEIGMNNPGEIAPLSRLARPHAAIITAIASAHIGNMGSIEAIADEKAAILDGLEPGGCAVLPADTPQLARLQARLRPDMRHVLFGREDVLACHADSAGSGVTALIGGVKTAFRINAPGPHMVSNAQAALLGAAALGADPARNVEGLANFQPVSGRGVRRPILGGAAVLLDESYNANTASVRAALAVLRLIPATRRIAILGDMLELGAFSESEHLSLLPDLRESADLLYACGPAMKKLYDSCPPQMQGLYCPTSAELAPLAAAAIRAGDAVLIKGSLGSCMARVVDACLAREA